MKLLRFLAFFLASVLALMHTAQVVVKNLLNDQDFTYVLSDSVQVGGIALFVVALSIFLKRNIWAYLFFLVLIASFSELLDFSDFKMSVSEGSFKIDLISFALLMLHIVMNGHLLKRPSRTKVEVEEVNNEKVEGFMSRLDKKSDEELLRMDETDLVPEAIEARKSLMSKRGI